MIQEALNMQTQTANANNGREAHCAESLTVEAERELKQVALDFGMQFARRQRIETIAVELRESLAQDNDRELTNYADLQDALYELKREVREYYTDEDDDLFGSISVFTGERDQSI